MCSLLNMDHEYTISLTIYGIFIILRNVSSFIGNGEILGAEGPRPTWYSITTSLGALMRLAILKWIWVGFFYQIKVKRSKST